MLISFQNNFNFQWLSSNMYLLKEVSMLLVKVIFCSFYSDVEAQRTAGFSPAMED